MPFTEKPLSSTPPLQQALTALALHAETLIQSERERDWMPLMRNKAFDLAVHDDARDPELKAYLDAAERRLHKGTVYRAGQQLQATESVFLLDGMIKLGESNVIIGQPKVGKSSFSTGLIAALRDRVPQFLGRGLATPNERMPVLVFGTDQSEGDWLHLLHRESLVAEDQTLKADSVDFFCSMETGEQYNFTKDGIRRMREEIEKHQFPLVIIDSLSSMMEPTGIEENTSRYAQPIRNAISQLRKTGATLVVIHHSVKRPTTWDWITECRGSSSISSVFSWGVLMRWVAQEEDGLARIDKRVGFAGKGRGANESGGVMGQYMPEGGWTYLDGLEEAQKVERAGQRIMELGGVRASIFDYLTLRTGLNADVSTEELATELDKQKGHVSRELRALKAKGLAEPVRTEETGSRPRIYWMASPAAMEWSLGGSEPGSNGSVGSFPIKSIKSNISNSQDDTSVLPSETKDPSSKSIDPKTKVEIRRGDEWASGFIVRNGFDPNKISVERLGNPMVTISNLRWELDVRLCQSGLQEPEPTELFDF
jgi:hypothetical protein